VAKIVNPQRPDLLQAVIEGDLNRLQRLLAGGADPNVADDAGWTALHFAAQRQDADQVRALLAAGAAVDAADAHGDTPLFRAVFTYRGSASTIEALKAAGADLYKRNVEGISPRSLAQSFADGEGRAAS
jgi:ankyrin repeat protein